jgi:hypothetical protein
MPVPLDLNAYRSAAMSHAQALGLFGKSWTTNRCPRPARA